MGETIKLKKLDYMICYLSEKGHNNFFYPSTIKAILVDGCKYEKLNYLGGSHRNLIAIKVDNKCLLPSNISPEVTEIIKKGSSVVWINK